MGDKITALIEILFDQDARVDEKDDAAMYLADFNDDRALKSLSDFASNPNENIIVLNSCGESIAEILIKRGRLQKEFIQKLCPHAKNSFLSVIESLKPEWIHMIDSTTLPHP